MKKFFTVSVVAITIMWAVGLSAFVPSALATTFSSGDLIKASLPAVYYYGADGKRYVFPDQKTYMTWYSDFSSVKTITDAELATITIGGNVTKKPGVVMVKITTDPKVYAVAADGTLRWVTTESIASSLYGSNWTKLIQDVPDAFFTNYTVGDAINSVSDYTPASATASAESINVDKGLTASGTTTTGGNLTVALASDTPASATVSNAASANLTKITLTTGSDAAVLKSLYITRYGLASNDDIENIKLVDASGSTVGTVGSLNASSKALISFVPNITLAANTTTSYWVRASILDTATSGRTVALGIATSSDVVLSGGTATGSFPVVGNYASIVDLAASLGTVEVDRTSASGVVDSQPDAGDKRVLVGEYKVSAGSNEDITLESLGLMEAGTASTSDYANIELYSLTNGVTLGTKSAWDANSRATFGNLNITITKGSTHIFQVYTDVVSGSGNKLNVDISDGNTDILVEAKGNTYGFYLNTSAGSNLSTGLGSDSGQTIGNGSLIITRATSSPSAGYITQATQQPLVVFSYEARGEEIKVNSTMVTIATDGTNLQADVDLANARLVDENGTLVAGPKAINASSSSAATVTFTETYIVPVGTHTYTFMIDILNSADNAGTIRAGIVSGADLTASGISTRNDLSATASPATLVASNVYGNLQTIKGGYLAYTNLTTPAARSIAKGSQKVLLATASLDATNSGENERISSLGITDTLSVANAAYSDIQNYEVWADLTSASSTRGDAYETKISNTTQPSDTTTDFSLTQTVTVTKGTYAKIAIIGDVSTSAVVTGANTHTIKLSSVGALGVSTGNAPDTNSTHGNGQTMTLTTAGSFNMVTIDSSSPSRQILIGGATKVPVMAVKVQADNIESMDLNEIIITDAATTSPVAGAWYLYSSARADGGSISDPVATAPGGAVADFNLTTGTVTIPASGSVVLTVKADVNGVDGITITNGLTFEPGVAAENIATGKVDIKATGKSSGSEIYPTDASGTITALSVADPVEITTGAAHGLVTGDLVTIAGGTAIDGTWAITKTAATKFTVDYDNSGGATDTGTWVKAGLGLSYYATPDKVYGSRPYVSLNSSSPSGSLTPSSDFLAAVWNIKADSADAITFTSANSLKSTLASFCSGVTGTGHSEGTATLKDEDGNTLDSQTIDSCTATSITWDFSSNSLEIAAGATKKVYMYLYTTGMIDTGDSLRLSFDPTAANINWAINSDGASTYTEGDVIFRGGLLGNTFVKG